MKMSPEILTRLLEGKHLNMEERKAEGLWPPETLQLQELEQHLASVLESRRWFPYQLEETTPGSAIPEGVWIHQETPGRFLYIAQRPRADFCTIMAEKSELYFESSCAAAKYYLKWGLNLPGDLDSWPVV